MSKKPKNQNSKFKINIRDFVFLGIIVLVFFLLRLVNLTILPVFVDEAIYIRWAQVMRAEPTLRFLPLSDGKQPLFMWLAIPFLKLFSDPLFAGRFVSVLAGLGSLSGIFLLTLMFLKKPKAALLASLIYAVIPYTVFFDRMALVDSLLLALTIWVAYFGVLLVKYLKLDLAMITGMILGGALITKSPALFAALLLPTTLLVAPWINGKKSRQKTCRRFLKLLVFWLVVYVFALGIYNLLRLGPNFMMITVRNKDYVFSLAEALKHPWDPLQFHLQEIFAWFSNLFTWPIFLLGLLGIIIGLKRKTRPTLYLFVWLAFPLLVQAEFAKVFTPRYLLFTGWPLVILAAYSLFILVERLSHEFRTSEKTPPRCPKDSSDGEVITVKLTSEESLRATIRGGEQVKCETRVSVKSGQIILLVLLVFLPALRYDWLLLFSPLKAPLPRRMRYGYLEEWTAGQGIKEVADFIKEKARTANILVGTEGFFGTLPDGLQIYLEKVPQTTVIGVGYPLSNVPESLVNSLVDNDVYLVVNQSRFLISPEAYGLKLIKEFPKAVNPQGKQDKLLFFELTRQYRLER